MQGFSVYPLQNNPKTDIWMVPFCKLFKYE